MNVAVCDICERKLNVDNINISYKVKAKKHAFDGWSSTYDHNVDVCDRCVSKINKLVNEDIARLCACGYAEECAVHCNHEAKLCPGKAYRADDPVNDLVVKSRKPTRTHTKSASKALNHRKDD